MRHAFLGHIYVGLSPVIPVTVGGGLSGFGCFVCGGSGVGFCCFVFFFPLVFSLFYFFKNGIL